MTMTFSNSIIGHHQLDFEHNTLAAAMVTSRSRSVRPNRTTKGRGALLDAKQTICSLAAGESLLGALWQAPALSRLLRLTPAFDDEHETSRQWPRRRRAPNLKEAQEEKAEVEEDEDEEIYHDATDDLSSAATTRNEVAIREAHEKHTTSTSGTLSERTAADAKTTITATTTATTTTTTTTTATTTCAPLEWQLECKYTLKEVQQHNSLDDCWMVIFDKVYNITDFVHEHPGGDFILFEYAGCDATHPFLSSRHGSSAYKMLDKYWIGILVDEELYYSNNSSYCSVYLDLSWRHSTPTMLDEAANNNNNNNNNVDQTPTSTNTASTSQTSSNSDLAASGE